jgi:hypothetical protein
MEEGGRAPWTIRIADSREERDRVFRFRFDSHVAEFGRWPTAGMRDRRMLREVADEGAVLLYAEWERRIAGALRLQIGPIPPDLRVGLEASRFRKLPPREIAVADRIVVARAMRRTTLLAEIVGAAERESAARGAAVLLSHAREDHAHFYTAIGFRLYAPPFEMVELGNRYPLVKAVGGGSSEEWLESELSGGAWFRRSSERS